MKERDDALHRFNTLGQNCAQAVLTAHAAELGLDEAKSLHISSCFGAGIGRKGLTCGAVTGACMVLGLRHGAEIAEGAEGRTRLYGRVQALLDRFEARFGSTECAVLTGCDLTAVEGRAEFERRGLHRALCSGLVAAAVEMLEQK